MSQSTSFVPYPEITHDDFYTKTFSKKEFLKTRTGPEHNARKSIDVCRPREFKLQNHQEFIRNFISPETPYNGVLLFHGTGVGKTCAAISITEGLRDYVHKMGKKIYIISAAAIAKNFYNELYNPIRAAKEKQLHLIPGSLQCAGDRYYIDGATDTDRSLAIKRKIHQYYEFFGPRKFANYVDITLRKNGGLSDKEIGEHFVNSVFVIDEAHSIAGKLDAADRRHKAIAKKAKAKAEQQQKKLAEGLIGVADYEQEHHVEKAEVKKRAEMSANNLLSLFVGSSGNKGLIDLCHEAGGNIKLILMSATPMRDNLGELAGLLKMLNHNDGRQIDTNKLFPNGVKPEDINVDFDKEYLKQISRGYISYVRGNNPITFPIPMLPPIEETYNPNPSGDNFRILLEGGATLNYNLYHCPMSIYQFYWYTLVEERLKVGTDINARQASNFIYPNDVDLIINGSTKDVSLNDLKKMFGTKGMNAHFKSQSKSLTSTRKLTTYEYQNADIDKYGLYLMLDNPVPGKQQYNLSLFSQKFANIIKNMNKSQGIAYAFSEFDQGSVQLLGLILEANGYIRYDENTVYNKTTGLPQKIDRDSPARTFVYNGAVQNKLFNEYLKTHFRCVCGELYDNHNNKAHPIPCEKFVQATYLMFTGSVANANVIKEMVDPRNLRGEKVKVLIGTEVTSEGVDLKWIRQVHIVEPWHNYTKIYQAIGRGIRYCSHIDLEPHERNCVIYKYSSAVPELKNLIVDGEVTEEVVKYLPNDDLREHAEANLDEFVKIEVDETELSLVFTYEDMLTATVDERLYKRAIAKDVNIKRVERVLKNNAVDCLLNRHMNYNPDRDIDYTRECDYSTCNYRCENQEDFVNIDLSVRLNKADNVFSFRSRLLLGNERWHTLESAEFSEQDARRLMNEIKNRSRTGDVEADQLLADWLFKYDPDSDELQSIAQEIYDQLQELVGAPAEMDDYYEIYYEKPIVTVDNSTYNIHFAAPQINNAKSEIAKLYVHNIALKEETITKMIHKKNPLIDDEFIKLALDQLVGNPPYIAPKIINDRYNRPSTLIYIGQYYVLQPLDLKNSKLPLHYRVKIPKLKFGHVNLNDLIHISKTEDKLILDTSKQETKLKKILDVFNTTQVPGKPKPVYLFNNTDGLSDELYAYFSDLLRTAIVRAMVDRMHMHEQRRIFQKVFTEPGYAALKKILVKYYAQQNLLIVADNGNKVYTFFKKVEFYDKSEKTWKVINISETIKAYIKTNKTKLINNNGDYQYDKIHLYVDIPGPRSSSIIKEGEDVTYAALCAARDNLVGRIKDPEQIVLKVYDRASENITKNKDGKKSKKTSPKGIVFKTTNQKQIKELIKNMVSNTHTSHGSSIKNRLANEIDNNLYKFILNQHNNIAALPGKSLTADINKFEFFVRIIDMLEYNNRRWFLSPLEFEFYRPLKR